MLLTVRMALDFAAAYDDLNPDDQDHLCYATLADELGATRVLDLGCGTGRLTRALAARGRTAVGIDPDPAMLRVARRRPGGEHVDWRLGFSDRADTGSADFTRPVEFWHETAWVSLPLVAYDTFTRGPRTGQDDVHREVLAFRDAAALGLSLETAGFTVSQRYGDWQRTPLTTDSPEIILVARRPA
jgi:SAM-dependent methyltransferase